MEQRYRTIVADPPWDYPEGWPVGKDANGNVSWAAAGAGTPHTGQRTPMRYPAMSIHEIETLPVCDFAAPAAHLYLWTTNRYLQDAFSVMACWGFGFSQMLVWAKTPMGIGPGGAWAGTTEYILFGRRGSLPTKRRWDSTWFNWPRMGKAHSRKPDAFLDMVEATSPGPYLELFARRQRLGWDTWGNEALEHVAL